MTLTITIDLDAERFWEKHVVGSSTDYADASVVADAVREIADEIGDEAVLKSSDGRKATRGIETSWSVK